MKLFDTTPVEYPEGHYSNLATSGMKIPPEKIREIFEESTTAVDFARRLLKALMLADLEALIDGMFD